MSIDPTAYVHPLAFVCGDVVLGPRASVWPYAVIRADNERIMVGAESNVQDGSVLHADPGVPCTIGARVVIGHRAIVHGATIGDDVLIGMGAILLNRSEIGAGSIIGAGALISEGVIVPPNSLVLGMPGRVVRATTAADRAGIGRGVDAYVRLQVAHAAGDFPRVRGGDGPSLGGA